MNNESLLLAAYHEAGRVVFAYLSGYTCITMELPGSGGNTKLNPENDIAAVQGVLTGNPLSLATENREHDIAVARKLMAIYSAGSCAEVYYQNGGSMPDELEMDMTGQDFINIEKIQAFLKKSIVDHSDDYVMQTMVSVFRKLNERDVWKAISLLATRILETENRSLTRFYIEDTLMVAGIRAAKQASSPGYSVGISEDKSPRPKEPDARTPPKFDFGGTNPLDAMVKDFLQQIKKDWKDGEVEAAMAYLHGVYGKYGQ